MHNNESIGLFRFQFVEIALLHRAQLLLLHAFDLRGVLDLQRGRIAVWEVDKSGVYVRLVRLRLCVRSLDVVLGFPFVVVSISERIRMTRVQRSSE